MKAKVGFAPFFLVWAHHLGWIVPAFHIRVCDFLENFYLNGRLALLMLPRGHSKSSILDVFNAWVIYNNPKEWILHQGTTDPDAFKCSNGTKHVLKSHPLCIANALVEVVRGETERWWVQGSDDPRYGTMYSKGILSGVTGHRATLIENDDVETPKTTGTQDAREKLKYRLTEQTHIAVPNAKKLYVGTPHSHDSLYEHVKELGADCLILKMFEHEARFEQAKTILVGFEPIHVFSGIGKHARYLEKDKDYTVEPKENCFEISFKDTYPLIDVYSQGLWEERFTPGEMAERRKECLTLNEWDSQYQMHAKPVGNVRLDPEKMLAYDCEPHFRTANKVTTMMLGNVKIVSASLHWDPSSGKLKSDKSSSALTFQDENGMYYWHRVKHLTGEVIEHDAHGNIIGGQVMQLCDLIEQYHLRGVSVEVNGIGGFAPASLRGALKKRGLVCAVVEQHSSENKNKRILDAIEAPLISGALWVHLSVVEDDMGDETETSKNMRLFNPETTNNVDDDIDSLAQSIKGHATRVGKKQEFNTKTTQKARHDWRNDTGCIEAPLDFN